jgi:hypothetical protein
MRPLRQFSPLHETITTQQPPQQRHTTPNPRPRLLSKTVCPPLVGAVARCFPSLPIHPTLAVKGRARCSVRIQLDVKSQLIVVHLRRLQKTTNLHRTLALLLLGCIGRLLALFRKQLGVVTRELLQRNEEVSQNHLESVQVRVGGKQPVNERRNLSTVPLVSAAPDTIYT